MIDERIRWPVKVIYGNDPDMNFEASTSIDLERTVEFWNGPGGLDAGDEVEIFDADGRQLTGVIDRLEIRGLRLSDHR